ncbi:SNF2-related protein [Natronospora cellulosivora (SeqCode)]
MYHLHLYLSDENISEEEIKKLLSESEGLAFIKGKWVEVNYEKLKETLAAYQEAQEFIKKKDMNVEAMRFQLSAAEKMRMVEKDLELKISNGEWLDTVIKKLIKPEEIEKIPPGYDFQAKLRDYQKKGLAWLNFMKKLELGACLADDMGLGKTIQVIALLNYTQDNQQEKKLLVVPTFLIGNWMNEFDKFAPKYYVLHSSKTIQLLKIEKNYYPIIIFLSLFTE